MSKGLRFAIVGCGAIGGWDAGVICDLEEAQLTALVDIVPGRAVWLAATCSQLPATCPARSSAAPRA